MHALGIFPAIRSFCGTIAPQLPLHTSANARKCRLEKVTANIDLKWAHHDPVNPEVKQPIWESNPGLLHGRQRF
jgi:hypothetical protein